MKIEMDGHFFAGTQNQIDKVLTNLSERSFQVLILKVLSLVKQ